LFKAVKTLAQVDFWLILIVAILRAEMSTREASASITNHTQLNLIAQLKLIASNAINIIVE
jgi:hypothetical protein